MKSYEENVCPKCGAEGQFSYGVIEVEDCGVFYPFTCGNCGAVGKEHYSLNFEESEVKE